MNSLSQPARLSAVCFFLHVTTDVTGNAINQTDVASTLQQCFCRRRFPHGRTHRRLQLLITIRALFLSTHYTGSVTWTHEHISRILLQDLYKVYITKQIKFTILDLPRQGNETKVKSTLWIHYSCWGVLQNCKRN